MTKWRSRAAADKAVRMFCRLGEQLALVRFLQWTRAVSQLLTVELPFLEEELCPVVPGWTVCQYGGWKVQLCLNNGCLVPMHLYACKLLTVICTCMDSQLCTSFFHKRCSLQDFLSLALSDGPFVSDSK